MEALYKVQVYSWLQGYVGIIMHTRYELSLLQGTAGREILAHVMDYEKRIKELLEAVSTLLEANKAMGEKIDSLTDELTAMQAKNALLESQVVKLTGELAQHKHSPQPYGRGSRGGKEADLCSRPD